MSGARVMGGVCGSALAIAMVFGLSASSQSGRNARERLIGAWHLVRMDVPGPDGKTAPVPKPKGMLIYTRDGHMSVQLMYPPSENTLSNEYVKNGYEASFGGYEVDEAAQTVTHHVQGSIHARLVGWERPASEIRVHHGRTPAHSVHSTR